MPLLHPQLFVLQFGSRGLRDQHVSGGGKGPSEDTEMGEGCGVGGEMMGLIPTTQACEYLSCSHSARNNTDPNSMLHAPVTPTTILLCQQ